MKIVFETEDEKEAARILKSNDMASFIWELVHNGWRDFKHTSYDYEKAWKKINQLLEKHDIKIDDIYE
jgi:uncharacterized lipoprotein